MRSQQPVEARHVLNCTEQEALAEAVYTHIERSSSTGAAPLQHVYADSFQGSHNHNDRTTSKPCCVRPYLGKDHLQQRRHTLPKLRPQLLKWGLIQGHQCLPKQQDKTTSTNVAQHPHPTGRIMLCCR